MLRRRGSWALLMRDEYNFVAALQREQLLSLRELVLQLVLATDMDRSPESGSKTHRRHSPPFRVFEFGKSSGFWPHSAHSRCS